MPIVVLILGLLGVAMVAGTSQAKTRPTPPTPGPPALPPSPKGAPQSYALDGDLPDHMRNQVLSALTSENDPNRLEALAGAISSLYPIAAAQLAAKATRMRGGMMPVGTVIAPPVQPLPPVAVPPVPAPAPAPTANPEIVDMPEPLRSEVMSHLMSDNDPASLEAFAARLPSAYVKAALALHMKATALRNLPGAPPPAPTPAPFPLPQPLPGPAPSPPQTNPEIVDMPEPLRSSVMQHLMSDSDPTSLESFATQLDPNFAKAAAALRAKATLLRHLPGLPPAPPPPVPMPAPLPTTNAPPSPAPPAPPAPSPSPSPFPFPLPPSLPGLDAGMPPDVAQAVVGALTTETDPAKLQGFAQSIQSKYPIAASLLMAKAAAMRGLGSVPAPVLPAPPAGQPMQPPPVVAPPLPPFPPLPGPTPPAPLYPVGSDATRSGRNAGRPTGHFPFVVLGTRGPGNAPITIAKVGAGSETEFEKLKPLNPQYRIGVDPEWIGQTLNVPWEWASKLQAAGYDVQQDPGASAPNGFAAAPVIHRSLAHGGNHAPST